MKISTSEDALLFAERPEWADVQPLEQYENANPIAPIFYTEECKHSFQLRKALTVFNGGHRQGCHKLLPRYRSSKREDPQSVGSYGKYHSTEPCALLCMVCDAFCSKRS